MKLKEQRDSVSEQIESQLQKAKQILDTPVLETRRNILIWLNVIFIIISLFYVFVHYFGYKNLPYSNDDHFLFYLVISINFLSLVTNVLVKFKVLKYYPKLFQIILWLSIFIMMFASLMLLHTTPNTAISLLIDSFLMVMLLFVIDEMLNRTMTYIWIVVIAFNFFLGVLNRGLDYEYHLKSKDEVIDFKNEQLKPGFSNSSHIYLIQEKIVSIPIYNVVILWALFTSFAIVLVYFRSNSKKKFDKILPGVLTDLEEISEKKYEAEKLLFKARAQLDLTQQVQTALLPKKQDMSGLQFLNIDARMDAAAEVGGDCYDFFVGSNYAVLAIGDVTGHGLESGLISMMAQTSFRMCVNENMLSLKDSISQINAGLYANIHRMKDNRNMTFSLVKFTENEILICGHHESLLIYRAATKSIEEVLTAELGTYLCIMNDLSQFLVEKSVPFNFGDIVLLYTDGIFDLKNKNEEYFGLERLKSYFAKYAEEDRENIINRIFSDFYSYGENSELEDDITMISVRRV